MVFGKRYLGGGSHEHRIITSVPWSSIYTSVSPKPLLATYSPRQLRYFVTTVRLLMYVVCARFEPGMWRCVCNGKQRSTTPRSCACRRPCAPPHCDADRH